MRRQHGSALILTMLILLVLTGLGMVAMHDVHRSVRQSGTYRVRTQAAGLSEAALNYTAFQTSESADKFWDMMNKPQSHAIGSTTDSTARLSNARRGAYIKMQQQAGASSGQAFPGLSDATETGLLTDGSHPSVESGFISPSESIAKSKFAVVIRDPIDGPPAPGYGDGWCYKKVLIASRAMVGEPSADWSGSGMVADKRNAIETYIGPVQCGAH